MNEVIAGKINELSFYQVLGLLGFIIGCLVVLIFAIVFAFDQLNVKTFSFRNGFTFYQDGDEKKTRITRRKKIVRRKPRV